MGECVVLVTPEYPPYSTGGGGVVVRELAQRLRRRGYRVIVLSGLRGGSDSPGRVITLVEDGIPVTFFPLIRLPGRLYHARAFAPPTLLSAAYLLRRVLEFRSCIFHLHGYGHPLVDIVASILWLNRSPFILTVHGIPKSPLYSGGLLSRLFYHLYMAASRVVLGKACSITAVSRSLAVEAEGLFSRPVAAIPNGPPSLSEAPPGSFKDKHSIPCNAKIIACIGELHPRKGFHRAIKAMPSILEEEPEAFLVIAGDGHFRRFLDSLSRRLGVSDRVLLVGRISEAEKTLLLSEASVVLVPSLIEPFGLVVLEAALSGVPVVASRVDGLGEMLRGYRFAVGRADPALIASKIIELLRDPSARDSAIRFLKTLLERLKWEDIVLSYEREYGRLAACRRETL